VPDAPYAQVSVQAPEGSVSGFTTDKKITLANEVFRAMYADPGRRPNPRAELIFPAVSPIYERERDQWNFLAQCTLYRRLPA
jgi:hypothetical protein